MDKVIPKPNQGTATEIFVELKKEHILKFCHNSQINRVIIHAQNVDVWLHIQHL